MTSEQKIVRIIDSEHCILAYLRVIFVDNFAFLQGSGESMKKDTLWNILTFKKVSIMNHVEEKSFFFEKVHKKVFEEISDATLVSAKLSSFYFESTKLVRSLFCTSQYAQNTFRMCQVLLLGR